MLVGSLAGMGGLLAGFPLGALILMLGLGADLSAWQIITATIVLGAVIMWIAAPIENRAYWLELRSGNKSKIRDEVDEHSFAPASFFFVVGLWLGVKFGFDGVQKVVSGLLPSVM